MFQYGECPTAESLQDIDKHQGTISESEGCLHFWWELNVSRTVN